MTAALLDDVAGKSTTTPTKPAGAKESNKESNKESKDKRAPSGTPAKPVASIAC